MKEGKEGEWTGRRKNGVEERYEENARRLAGRNIASLPETRRYEVRLKAGNGETPVRMSLAQAVSAGVPQEAIGRDAETDAKEMERILSGILRNAPAYLSVRTRENGDDPAFAIAGTRVETIASGNAGPVILEDGSASGKIISCSDGRGEILVIALNRSEKAAIGRAMSANDGEYVISLTMDRRRLLSQEMAKAGEENEESRKNRRRY